MLQFILLVALVTAQAPVSGQDSVIVFAVNQIASALQASNQFILNSLYSSERAGIDINDADAIFSAVRKSRRMREPAWHAAIARELSRRASFITDGVVECVQANATNSTTFTAAAFGGESVFLQSNMYVDGNCNGRFDGKNSPDQSFPDFFNTTLFNQTLLRVLEVVQSTSDLRLKRFITLAPAPLNATSSTNATLANISTPLFFQPGMSSLFLPTMTAFQHIDFGLVVSLVGGEALYANAGGVEAPISFIESFGEQCTSGATAGRFNSAPIDLRWGFSSNLTAFGAPPSAGATLGQCIGGSGATVLANNVAANLLAGVLFLDANADGIRQPREVLAVPPGVEVVALLLNDSSKEFIIQTDEIGRFLGVLSLGNGTGVGNVTTLAISPAISAATIGVQLVAGRPGQLKDALGFFNESTICGTVLPKMSVTVHVLDKGSQATTDQAMFLNQARVNNTPTSLLVGQTLDPEFRVPNMNIGFVCAREGLEQVVQVTPSCGNANLSASQPTIVDTFQIEIIGNIPEFQTWATAVTARRAVFAPITANETFDVMTHTVTTTFASALNTTFGSGISSAVIAQIKPTGLIVDFQVPKVADRDQPLFSVLKFNVSIVTNYARPQDGLNCSGVPGAEIVSEFILTDYSGALLMTIGDIGGLCRHTQPEECITGGTPTPNNTESGGTLPPGPSGTLPFVLIFAGVALIVFFAMVFIAAR